MRTLGKNLQISLAVAIGLLLVITPSASFAAKKKKKAPKKSKPETVATVKDKNFTQTVNASGILNVETLKLKVAVKYDKKAQKTSQYRFKFGPADTTVCSSAAGYGKWAVLKKAVELDLKNLPDGTFHLCVLGKYGKVAQKPAKATLYKWIKNVHGQAFGTPTPVPVIPTATPVHSPTPTATPTPHEAVAKNHISDTSCWDTNAVFSNYNGPAEEDDSIGAAAFTGKGGILKRVGAIFSISDCEGFNNGSLQNMEVSLAFYENAAAFIADPYLKNQPPGSPNRRIGVSILNSDPQSSNYYLNPVRTTPSGTNQYYLETDVTQFEIQTQAGQEHLVALWLKSDSPEDGATWIAFSKGCAGQVGSNEDYYASDNNHYQTAPNAPYSKTPGKFSATGGTHNFGAYLVTELVR